MALTIKNNNTKISVVEHIRQNYYTLREELSQYQVIDVGNYLNGDMDDFIIDTKSLIRLGPQRIKKLDILVNITNKELLVFPYRTFSEGGVVHLTLDTSDIEKDTKLGEFIKNKFIYHLKDTEDKLINTVTNSDPGEVLSDIEIAEAVSLGLINNEFIKVNDDKKEELYGFLNEKETYENLADRVVDRYYRSIDKEFGSSLIRPLGSKYFVNLSNKTIYDSLDTNRIGDYDITTIVSSPYHYKRQDNKPKYLRACERIYKLMLADGSSKDIEEAKTDAKKELTQYYWRSIRKRLLDKIE